MKNNNKSNYSKYSSATIDNSALSSLINDTIDSSLSNTTTTSSLNSASNISSSSTSSNNYIYTSTISNSTPGSVWVTPSTAYGYSYNNLNLDSLYSPADSDILKYLTEEEIIDIIEKIISRSEDRTDVNNVLKMALKTRSFSEDFLLKYFDYLKDYKEYVLIHHSGQIRSGEYKAIALAFEANKGE